MKKKVLAAILIAVGVLTGCGNTEPISSPIQTVEAEPIATDIQEVEQPGATEEANENHDGMYRSELTNEWIDESLKDQRPIAVMVDNEKTALPHFGVADADVVYEIMNSTLNDRITRFMVVVKDWDKIEQLGSIRSARPTNFMLAAEWNAVLCHDGGPFFINDWVAKDYSANFSGGLKAYSVVCGSFGVKANAEGLKQYLDGQGYNAKVVYNAERNTYRVIASSYDDRAEATQAKEEFKAKYPNRDDFQKAWLLYRVY